MKGVYFHLLRWVSQVLRSSLWLVILFALFVGRFFPDSHSSALVRISIRFERTEVRSLPLFLSSHSSFQLGCLHAASLQPHRASLTPLGRVRVPLVFVRVISGIPSLLSRNSVSLSLPARSVVRRVAFFGSCTFLEFSWFKLLSLFFSPFLCSRLRLAQSSSPSACSSNAVASCRVSVLVSSALLNSRCQWRWVYLFYPLHRLLVSTTRGSLGRISSVLVW